MKQRTFSILYKSHSHFFPPYTRRQVIRKDSHM